MTSHPLDPAAFSRALESAWQAMRHGDEKTSIHPLTKQAMRRALADGFEAYFSALQPQAPAEGDDDPDYAYELGVRDGYESGIQDADLVTTRLAGEPVAWVWEWQDEYYEPATGTNAYRWKKSYSGSSPTYTEPRTRGLAPLYAASSQPPQSDWRPIDTAPKDGNEILVSGPDFDDGYGHKCAATVDIVYWDEEFDMRTGSKGAWVISCECENRCARPLACYTVWKPVPSRPDASPQPQGIVAKMQAICDNAKPPTEGLKQIYGEYLASQPQALEAWTTEELRAAYEKATGKTDVLAMCGLHAVARFVQSRCLGEGKQ